MEREDGRYSVNYVLSFPPITESCLLKSLRRPFLRLHYFDALDNLPFSFQYASRSLVIPKTEVNCLFRRTWSLFPTVYAGSPTKSVFSLEQSKETGMDRLKAMFKVTEHGHLSPELSIVSNTVGIAAFMGAAIGGILASRTAVENLVRQYQSAVFNNQFEGKRMFQDRITLALAGTAFKWAWRLALFSGTYTTIVISATVYNNKSSIWEHIAAGAITGGLWKIKMGLPAAAVGGGLGGILGLFAGCTCACVLWLSDTSVEEMRYWHHDYWEREYRRQVKEMKAKDPEQITELLAMEHDDMLEGQKATSSGRKNSS